MRIRLALLSLSFLAFSVQASAQSKVSDPPGIAVSQLRFSTYLGGTALDQANAMATGSDGSLYVAGVTKSTDFPGTTMAPRLAGRSRAFVAKFSSDGKSVLWSVYLGGSGDDEARALAVDPAGNVFVAGRTTSSDFPVAGAFQASCRLNASKECPGAAFLAKFSAAGELLYATYLGGSGDNAANALAVDSQGRVYVAGETSSTDFPIFDAFQSAPSGGKKGFIARFAADGRTLDYASYLGGSGDDSILGMALDAAGNVFLTGQTHSFDFPVRGSALQSSCRAIANGQCAGAAFVAKVSTDGRALAYSTYLGGSAEDKGNAIAIDAMGNAYVTGSAKSLDFPSAQAGANLSPTAGHVFVSKVDPLGSNLLYSTLIGGNDADAGQAIAIDRGGRAHITGWTRSTNFPVAHPMQSSCRTDAQGVCKGAAIAAVLSPDGQQLAFSTYLGGSGDSANAVSLDAQGSLRLAGTVASSNFPLTNAVQASAPAGGDALVAKIDVSFLSTPLTDCTSAKQWNNVAGGEFNVAGNWTPSGVPGATDDACIPSAFSGVTVTFATGATVTVSSLTAFSTFTFSGGNLTLTNGGQLATANLTGGNLTTNGSLLLNGATLLSSGSLNGSGDISTNAAFTWTNGSISGTATPNAAFNVGGTIDFNGSNVNGSGHQLNQRTFNFATGTTTISGQNSSFTLGGGAVFHVPSGGILAFDKDGGVTSQGIFNGGGVASTIVNDGIIRKLAGNTGGTFFGIAQNISATGHFEVLSGSININSGGSSTGGTFLATSPGAFNFNTNFTFDAATSMTGTGDYIFSGGTYTITGTYNVSGDTNISGGTVAFNSTPTMNTLHLISGTLTGSANFAPTGLFTWTGGILDGTATPNATFTIGAGGVDFNGGNVTARAIL